MTMSTAPRPNSVFAKHPRRKKSTRYYSAFNTRFLWCMGWFLLIVMPSFSGSPIGADERLSIPATKTEASRDVETVPQPPLRVASFNVAMYSDEAGRVFQRLAGGGDAQAIKIARIIRTIRPDVLLLCEIDHESDG